MKAIYNTLTSQNILWPSCSYKALITVIFTPQQDGKHEAR